MSAQLFPDENLLLYVNMSGELFYIVVHRMECQGIESQLQATVAHQLILGICSPEVVNDVSEGRLRICDQHFDVMRTMVKELVDSTIMKINDYSMEKLFELTLIATKYQYTVCTHPKSLLLIALNHLDGIRSLAKEARAIELGEGLHRLLVDSYASQSTSQMESYRQAILHYVQDVRLKMTNLVILGLQDENGDFIGREEDDLEFPDGGDSGEEEGGDGEDSSNTKHIRYSLELNGDRIITLGRSIYSQKIPQESSKPTTFQPLPESGPAAAAPVMSNELRDGVEAVQGLEFCRTLLDAGNESGSTPPSHPGRRQRFHVGNAGEHAAETLLSRKDSTQTIRIDARLDRADTQCPLIQIVKQFEDAPSTSALSTVGTPSTVQSSRNTLYKLMENMLIDEL